jgi:GAF domain-containing protein
LLINERHANRSTTLKPVSEAGSDMGLDREVAELVRRPTRLRALAALEANAESSAEALDRIAGLACRVLDVPVVLVNLVGSDRQRFVGCATEDEEWASMDEMPLTYGFCPFAMAAADPYFLEDARADLALAENPAVTQLGVVAYAGVPLRVAGGEPIGTVCAIDRRPRAWTGEDLQLLADLAASATAELQLLTATRVLARQQLRLASLTELSGKLATASTPDDLVGQLATLDRLGAAGVWLLARDDGDQTLRTAGSDGLASPDLVSIAAASAPAEAAGGGRPAFLHTHAAVRERFGALLDARSETEAAAVLPLIVGGRPTGALAVAFDEEHDFADDERRYLEAIAGVSALALAGLTA